MIATIFDYGAGNLHSLAKALNADDIDVCISDDALAAANADLLVLPGVGSFAYAAERLSGARTSLRERIIGGLPVFGICLGMQLLFDESDEGPGLGLGVFSGRVTRLSARRVPHIGWNSLDDVTDSSLADMRLTSVYYANSFACRPLDASHVTAWTTYDGDRFPAMVRRENVAGMQFHPEKSSAAGVAALRSIARELIRGATV